MVRKFSLLLLVFTAISAGTIFAQGEYEGFIKPTFSGGYARFEKDNKSESYKAVDLDVDFVHSTGLTLGLVSGFAWNDDYTNYFPLFGAGYTYDAGQWCAGAKVVNVPLIKENDGGMGVDANLTWWFVDSLGLTGSVGYLWSMGKDEWNVLLIRGGISLLF
jgi:hypothetical protein